jgi:hypothetical protein
LGRKRRERVAYALELLEDVFVDSKLLEGGADGGYHVVDDRAVYRRLLR